MKKIVALVIIVNFILSFSTTADAADYEIAHDNLRYSSNIQIAIEDYFSLRNDWLYGNYSNVSCSVESHSLEFLAENEARFSARNKLEECNIHVIDAQNTIYIQSPETTENSSLFITNENEMTVEVYEWNMITYNDGNGSAADEMGYGINHTIVMSTNADGKYEVIDDIYEEPFFLSEDFDYIESTAEDNDIAAVSDIYTEAISIDTYSTTINAKGTVDYNVNKVIAYADAYVKHDTTNTMVTEYYNPEYGYYAGADCANYVSQCLEAGGMEYDYGSGKNYASWDADQWWYDGPTGDQTPTAQLDSTSAVPWRYVSHFVLYWESKGYNVSEVSSLNIFPGNPVIIDTITSDSRDYNHATICVGYNSSGVPILNSHNTDLYHIPYTFYNSFDMWTIQLVESNQMIYKPATATTINPTTTEQTKATEYVPEKASKYYKIVVPSTATYTFHSIGYSGTTHDTAAYLYKESSVGTNNKTYYLDEIASDDDSGDLLNFRISVSLTPGTYYLRVYFNSETSGYYGLVYKKG